MGLRETMSAVENDGKQAGPDEKQHNSHRKRRRNSFARLCASMCTVVGYVLFYGPCSRHK